MNRTKGRGKQELKEMRHHGLARKGFSCLLMAVLLIQSGIALADTTFVRDGRAGFVVSDIKFALAPDAVESGACPGGLSRNLQEVFEATAEGKRKQNESDKAYGDRLQQAARKLGTAPNGQNLCMHPEAGRSDPYYRTVERSDIPVDGIDLDGVNSVNDFPALQGGEGIDNQYYRVVGCSRSYQSSGQSNGFAIEMLTGSWGIVITLDGVDDIHNDDQVAVGIHANADPIALSPDREPLAYATYAINADPRFRATTTGRIEDGVLMTEPVDVRFYSVTNSMVLERPLRDARIVATLSDEGALDGYLAGYSPVEAIYDVHYGFRSGMKNGEPAPIQLKSGSANGTAFVLGHTCHGVYHALYEHADGHPDPETGEFTSISTQFKIEAIPAFVVAAKSPADAGMAVSKEDEHAQ